MTLQVDRVRSRFPALRQEFNGRRAVFFDNPGGTQVPQSVIDAVADYYVQRNANVHGMFETSRRTDRVVEEAHQAVADLLNADPDEVVFGPNMTTLTFQLSRSLAHEMTPGDEIIVTRLDHDANIAPWLRMAEERDLRVHWIDFDPAECTLRMDQLKDSITSRTRLIAIGYAANSTGTVNEVAKAAQWARTAGAHLFVDAVQYAPHGPIDVRALDCDFLACSAYKFFGPHAGHLYGRRELLRSLRPYKVRPATEELPYRWETGTQNHEAMAGVTAAIDYLAGLGVEFGGASPREPRRARLLRAWEQIREYETSLSKRFLDGLASLPGVRLYGISSPERLDQRLATFALRIEGVRPVEAAAFLADRHIFCWHGNFYALAVTESLGLEAEGGLLRVGLAHYNTAEEIDQLLEALAELSARS